jgi:hypothetical protein
MVGTHPSKKLTVALEPKLSQNTCLKLLDSAYIFGRYLFIYACYPLYWSAPASNTAFIISLKRITCFALTFFHFKTKLS